MPYSQPNYKRKVNYSQRNVSKKPRIMVTRVPRAITTRGTSAGYYEIPVTNIFKIYWATSTGLWSTNQDTGGLQGLTGYRGFCLNTSLSDCNIALGEGASTVNITVPVPGFSQLQSVFDLVKIARIHVEITMQNSADDINAAGSAAAAMFMFAKDLNSFVPPASKDAMCQYQDLKTVSTQQQNGIIKYTFTPYCSIDANTIGDGSQTSGINTPAVYCSTDKPGVAHRGLVGWIDPAISGSTVRQGYMYVKVTQVRRYKVSR